MLLIDYLTIGHNHSDNENDRDPSARLDEIMIDCAHSRKCASAGRVTSWSKILNPDFNRKFNYVPDRLSV
jgi:hypothetical protein